MRGFEDLKKIMHEYLQMYLMLKDFVIFEFPHRMHYFTKSL